MGEVSRPKMPKFGPEKCPVYLFPPWLGLVSTRFELQVKSTVEQSFFRCGTTCCLLHQPASLPYQQGCTACFTEKQLDLLILMPL